MPFKTGIGSEVKLSNINLILLFDSNCWIKLIIELGMRLFLRLWISLFVTALGNALSTSRKRTEVNLLVFHALCILWVK